MADLQQLDQLVLEIKFYSQQTALNMIEVGKRLIEAKKEVGHGEWGKWLENVDYSQERARQFMRVAEEFGDSNTCCNLTPSKVIAMLDIPTEVREEFLNKPHELPSGETKTVTDMTTRELQAAIKAQKEAEQKLAEELEESKKLEEAISITEEDNVMLRRENKKLTDKLTETIVPTEYEYLKTANEILINKLKTAGEPIIVEMPVQVFPPDYERIKQENEQLRNQKPASPEFRQYAQQIENEAEIAGKISDALMNPQLVSMKNIDQAVRCYFEYSPNTVSDAMDDCDRSITILQNIKQAFVNMTKLKVVKK